MNDLSLADIQRKINEIISRFNLNNYDLAYLEDNMPFIVYLGKEYDKRIGSFSLSNEERLNVIKYYELFSNYLLRYMSKKYHKGFSFDILSEKFDSSCYVASENKIYLSRNIVGKQKFEMIMFTIFHEFRHKKQRDDETSSINNIMEIDPAAVIMLKEESTLIDADLYKNNHNCFIAEHDANLFSLSECKSYIDTKSLEQQLSGIEEKNDFIGNIMQGGDLSTFEYSDKQKLPIIYEQDYRVKKIIEGKNVSQNSLLSLIYGPDGKPKTYEELLEDKKKLIARFKNSHGISNRKSSTTNYDIQSYKSAAQHIEEIYKLIIASDPILTLQENFYKYNTIDNKFIAKRYINKIVSLLSTCPQLSIIYNSEIKSILVKEIDKGNEDVVEEIIRNDETLRYQIHMYMKRVNSRKQQAISKSKSSNADDSELYEDVNSMGLGNDAPHNRSSSKKSEEYSYGANNQQSNSSVNRKNTTFNVNNNPILDNAKKEREKELEELRRKRNELRDTLFQQQVEDMNRNQRQVLNLDEVFQVQKQNELAAQTEELEEDHGMTM